MKNKVELDRNILSITMKIQKEFPELSKYLIETPVKFSESNSNGINNNNLEDYYNTLNELLKSYSNEHLKMDILESNKLKQTANKTNLIGFPVYLSKEDAHNKWKEATELNPEDISKQKIPNEKSGTRNEKDFEDDISGKDLDVPGSELDDQQEKIGSEDEENNYYSLGGDNHDD